MTGDERRRGWRFELELPAAVAPVGPLGLSRPCHLVTRNISASGAFFKTALPYPVGEQVQIELTLCLGRAEGSAVRGMANIELTGTVVRAQADGMAVAFSNGYEIAGLGEVSGGMEHANLVN